MDPLFLSKVRSSQIACTNGEVELINLWKVLFLKALGALKKAN